MRNIKLMCAIVAFGLFLMFSLWMAWYIIVPLIMMVLSFCMWVCWKVRCFSANKKKKEAAKEKERKAEVARKEKAAKKAEKEKAAQKAVKEKAKKKKNKWFWQK